MRGLGTDLAPLPLSRQELAHEAREAFGLALGPVEEVWRKKDMRIHHLPKTGSRATLLFRRRGFGIHGK